MRTLLRARLSLTLVVAVALGRVLLVGVGRVVVALGLLTVLVLLVQPILGAGVVLISELGRVALVAPVL